MNTLLMLFLFIPVLVIALLFLNYILAASKPDSEKLSIYECGFSAVYGQTRSTFHINFYLVAMFFLIFDLEILLLFPISISLYQVGNYGFTVALLFFIVLTIGFVLEIASGAINISNININSSSALKDSAIADNKAVIL
jgi:NADH:ubiquinone oxidoreductase subunit 3 (subunit A)